MRKFSQDEWSTVSNALRVAAERFDEDAKVARESGAAFARIAQQFEQQAQQSRALLEEIETEGYGQ